MSFTGLVRSSECFTEPQKQEMLRLVKENERILAVMYEDAEETVRKDKKTRMRIRRKLEKDIWKRRKK